MSGEYLIGFVITVIILYILNHSIKNKESEDMIREIFSIFGIYVLSVIIAKYILDHFELVLK